jgi:hypothetical protein
VLYQFVLKFLRDKDAKLHSKFEIRLHKLTIVMQKISNGLMQSYHFKHGVLCILGKQREVFKIFECIFNKNDLTAAMTLFDKFLETNPDVHTNIPVMQLFTMVFLNELIQLNMVALQA